MYFSSQTLRKLMVTMMMQRTTAPNKERRLEIAMGKNDSGIKVDWSSQSLFTDLLNNGYEAPNADGVHPLTHISVNSSYSFLRELMEVWNIVMKCLLVNGVFYC